MLGRLEMDVDACIASYSELMKKVFEEKSRWLPFNWRGRMKAGFDSAKLKTAIEDVISSAGASPTDAFNGGDDRGCRTWVYCIDARPPTNRVQGSSVRQQERPAALHV
jgi:hypothetical protein